MDKYLILISQLSNVMAVFIVDSENYFKFTYFNKLLPIIPGYYYNFIHKFIIFISF